MTIFFPPLEGGVFREEDRVWHGIQQIDVHQLRSGWQDWTPSYTNLTVGNGTVVARYTEMGKLVVAWYELTWGSTTSISASNPQISLPVEASSAYTTARNNLGPALLFDAAPNAYEGITRLWSTTSVHVRALNASGTYLTQANISATIPFTWTTSDILSFLAVYEAAA